MSAKPKCKPHRADSERLQAIIDEYQLEVNGTHFWAPYWVNIPDYLAGPSLSTPTPNLRGPYKGKGTPAQLRGAVTRLAVQQTKPPHSPEGYRRLMRRHGLGIDCSGFVYYVLNKFIIQTGRGPLKYYLFIPKADVIELWEKYHQQNRPNVPTKSQLTHLPQLVPMTEFSRLFHKNPIHHTNVARLVQPASVMPVKTAAEIQPGDLIKMTSEVGDHLGIVVITTTKTIVFWSSDDPKSGLGGPARHEITVQRADEGLEYQDWPLKALYHPGKADGVFRPKALQ